METAIALSLTYLDEPAQAEHALLVAVDLLTQAGDELNRGRARTNLANLYGRLGQFARGLEQINLAVVDLLGTADVDAVPERWPRADVLFLEQATILLALNLLPEAGVALDHAEQLFRRTGQRYELGQTLYLAGLLNWRREDVTGAGAALHAAGAIFADLQNRYWQQRVRLASAGLAFRQGDIVSAAAQLDDILASADAVTTMTALVWDKPALAEATLLRLQMALAAGDLPAARRFAEQTASALDLAAPDDEQASTLPHLQLHLLHALGQIERAAGNTLLARRHLGRAIDLVEAQRAVLPLEELRTAFLADKTAVYVDMVLSLLDAPTPDADAVAAAFGVVERARSWVLLERLMTALAEPEEAGASTHEPTGARGAELRRQLAWLYNQLLGESGGSRRAAHSLTAEIRLCEAALQRLEWQASSWLGQAEPATLAALQAILAPDEQALAYFIAGDEVMAFVVAPEHVQVTRRLCSLKVLHRALADLRFQMGRVEIGADHVARHEERLLAAVRSALHTLHRLLIAPLQLTLTAARLLIVPYGPLHLLPFHALWDGEHYLLETHEVSYAPSASLAIHCHRDRKAGRYGSLAALALRDPAIPQAEAEIRAAAAHFERVALYLDADAGIEGLRRAPSRAMCCTLPPTVCSGPTTRFSRP